MAKKFQNLTIDYTQIIDKMSVGDRMSMLRSPRGRDILISLTPYQLADMFPDYYKKHYPDVGKLLKSITDPSFKALSRSQADRMMGLDEARIRSKERTAVPEAKPNWLRKIEEQTGKTISDPGAKAQLSDAKKELLKEMESGGVKADDPRAKFLMDLSPDDLKKAGIAKQTDEQGNTVYRRTEISDAEAKAKAESIDPHVEAIRKTILGKESSGNYSTTSFAEGRGSSASGGYQFADATWQEQARKAGVDTTMYPRAKMAPPEVQDAVARSYIKDILDRNGGDVSAVPREWYAGPKGYLTPRELEVNRGLTVEKYVQDWMEKYQNNAKASGVPGSQVATSLEEGRKQIREEQQSSLAARTEIPDLPQGVDPNIAAFYNRLSPRQKQDFYEMLATAGGGKSQEQIASGVAKVNNLYKEDPRAVQQGIFTGNGKLLFSDQSVAERAAQLDPYTQGALNKFQEFTPPGTMITSTFRGENHPIEAAKIARGQAPGAHSRGAAVDIRTEGKSREELAATVQALKRAGFTKVLLEGDHIHAEVNPGQSFHISNLGMGNPNIDLRTANDAAGAVAFNEELPGNQRDRQQARPAAVAQTEPTAVPTQRPEITTTQEQPQARFERPLGNTPMVETSRTVQRPEPVSTEQPQSNTVVAQTETLPAQPVNVYAEGGSQPLNTDEIRAMPIDSLKGDNSVVIDKNDKPLFTMNTKEEQASYDPKAKQVDIQPLTKTNPDTLGEKQTTETMDYTLDTTMKSNQPPPQPQTSVSQSNISSTDTSVSITDELFKDPSFKRAIAKTRFVDTGDAALGGHFGMANADLG